MDAVDVVKVLSDVLNTCKRKRFEFDVGPLDEIDALAHPHTRDYVRVLKARRAALIDRMAEMCARVQVIDDKVAEEYLHHGKEIRGEAA